MTMPFAKYQALGNSFIVLDEIQQRGRLKRFESMTRAICNPTTGVGADGLLIISGVAPGLQVDIYNADGSWAEKSGNGVRIAAMHMLNAGIIAGPSTELLTGSGISRVTLHGGSPTRRVMSASLGKPEFATSRIPMAVPQTFFINQEVTCGERTYVASAVSIGNPHLILFCDDFEFDWQSIGRELEVDPLFPRRINVGFVVVRDADTLEVRDWERGVGPTSSSGTGAAAALAIAVMRGFTSRIVDVHAPAGVLRVTWEAAGDEMIIKGPVEFVCAGEFRVS
jgi:diaminopimelate epimerase